MDSENEESNQPPRGRRGWLLVFPAILLAAIVYRAVAEQPAASLPRRQQEQIFRDWSERVHKELFSRMTTDIAGEPEEVLRARLDLVNSIVLYGSRWDLLARPMASPVTRAVVFCPDHPLYYPPLHGHPKNMAVRRWVLGPLMDQFADLGYAPHAVMLTKFFGVEKERYGKSACIDLATAVQARQVVLVTFGATFKTIDKLVQLPIWPTQIDHIVNLGDIPSKDALQRSRVEMLVVSPENVEAKYLTQLKDYRESGVQGQHLSFMLLPGISYIGSAAENPQAIPFSVAAAFHARMNVEQAAAAIQESMTLRPNVRLATTFAAEVADWVDGRPVALRR